MIGEKVWRFSLAEQSAKVYHLIDYFSIRRLPWCLELGDPEIFTTGARGH
jgi:hypothetical protein